MEAPDPPIAVEPVQPAASSRPGPVFGIGEGGFQNRTTGKYAVTPSASYSETFVGSSQPSPRQHRSATSYLTSGRTFAASTMEAPDPPITVEPLQPATSSRPGPVYGIGVGGFQNRTTGKYAVIPCTSYPETFVVSSQSSPRQHRSASSYLTPERTPAASCAVPTNKSTDRLFSVYYQNVRGLRTKIVQLRLLLSSCDYDVLVLTETWLRPDIVNAEITSDYTLFRCDRSHSTSQCARGGGVLIAVKNHVKCKSVSLSNCEQLEQVAVCVKTAYRSLYIVAVYLPPNSSHDLYTAHANAVQCLANRCSDADIILSLGDFNLPNLRWQLDEDINGYIPTNVSSEPERALIETMFAIGLQQVCNLVNTNGRLLDLVFVNLPDHLDLIAPSTPLLPVDTHHEPFILLFNESGDDLVTPDDCDENFNFNFYACDFDRLNCALANIDWELILRNGTVDETLSTFYGKLYEVLNDHVPRKRRASASVFNKPWWTPELRHLRNTLRKARNQFFLTKSARERNILREVETTYKALLLSSYENYISTIQFSVKHNPSLFWDFVRKQKSTTRIPYNVKLGESHARSNAEAADLFATFFESVFSNVSPVPRCNCFAHISSQDITLPVVQFSSNDVLKAVEDLDIKKVSSTDGIPPLLLKKCSATLAMPIALIFNRSLRDRTFPAAWKHASIVPIHKSGNCISVDNYRGISILSSLSKVFEKLVHNVLYNVASSIISDSQHGFMKHRSSTTNLMCYVTTLSREIELGRQVDSVYVDFAKAFDTVPHILVINKMKHIGFPDWFTEWLWSYLSDRSAHVVVNTARSRSFNISSGVPQGSVLGPLIFNIFVNDLSSLLSSFKLSFADDLKIYRIVISLLDCVDLQEDINTVLIWCGDNGMQVNSRKCKVISFSRCNKPIHHIYSMDKESLNRVMTICDLGVTIDTKLRFTEHVKIIAAKAFSVLGFIRRHASDFTDIHALKMLYCSLVRSVLEYAAPVWCPYHTTQILTIERVQRKFIRFALRQLPWNDPANLPPYSDRCLLIDLETLSCRRVKLQRLFVFDVLQGNIDCPALLEQIPLNVPPRRFRSSSLLAVRHHRTNYGYYNPFDSCLRAFNNVSDVFNFNLTKSLFSIRIRNIN